MKRALSDSTIVITGASSGFGRGTALRLAKEYGCNLVLGARSPNSLAEVARDCEAAGARAVSVTCDVGRADDIERLASTARSKFGGFDIWINNAGICALGRFEDIPLADHEKLVQTNLLGTLYGSYTAMGHFRKTHRDAALKVNRLLKFYLPRRTRRSQRQWKKKGARKQASSMLEANLAIYFYF